MQPKFVAGVGGIVLLAAVWIATTAGTIYVAYLIILALKKYIGA